MYRRHELPFLDKKFFLQFQLNRKFLRQPAMLLLSLHISHVLYGNEHICVRYQRCIRDKTKVQQPRPSNRRKNYFLFDYTSCIFSIQLDSCSNWKKNKTTNSLMFFTHKQKYNLRYLSLFTCNSYKTSNKPSPLFSCVSQLFLSLWHVCHNTCVVHSAAG